MKPIVIYLGNIVSLHAPLLHFRKFSNLNINSEIHLADKGTNNFNTKNKYNIHTSARNRGGMIARGGMNRCRTH